MPPKPRRPAETEPRTDEMPERYAEPTHDEIARRAHEISLSDEAGTDEENWHRAERELRQGRGGGDGPWAKIGSGDTESMTTGDDEPITES
jgi:hypothetical protein